MTLTQFHSLPFSVSAYTDTAPSGSSVDVFTKWYPFVARAPLKNWDNSSYERYGLTNTSAFTGLDFFFPNSGRSIITIIPATKVTIPATAIITSNGASGINMLMGIQPGKTPMANEPKPIAVRTFIMCSFIRSFILSPPLYRPHGGENWDDR